jgi:hypothetical protein
MVMFHFDPSAFKVFHQISRAIIGTKTPSQMAGIMKRDRSGIGI